MATLPQVANSNKGSNQASAAKVDMKLEVVVIAVSDVDRAKDFYGRLGWRLDIDFVAGNDFRVVQFTPPGSGCSVHFGKNVTSATPGSSTGYLVVSNIETAREELVSAGAKVGEFFHVGFDGGGNGLDPDRRSYQSRASFSDPDGNVWILQEVTTRLPGRGFSLDVPTLTELLRETETRHGGYESSAPKHHWSSWY